jgi:hypothetical protein
MGKITASYDPDKFVVYLIQFKNIPVLLFEHSYSRTRVTLLVYSTGRPTNERPGRV